FIDPHPHERERMLTRELSAGTGALVSAVCLVDHHAIGGRARALAFTPNQPVTFRQCRPRGRFQQFSSSCERCLIWSERLDPLYRECHSAQSRAVTQPCQILAEFPFSRPTPVVTESTGRA